jgi:hypothetical protein
VIGETPGDGRGDHHRQHHRHEQPAGLAGIQVEQGGGDEGDLEHQGVHHQVLHRDQQGTGRERHRPEQGERDDRVTRPALPPPERNQEADTDEQQDQVLSVGS